MGLRQTKKFLLLGASNLWPASSMKPRVAVNAARHKIINLLKMLWDIFVIMCYNVFNVWCKTIIFPMWPRGTKSLDIPATFWFKSLALACHAILLYNNLHRKKLTEAMYLIAKKGKKSKLIVHKECIDYLNDGMCWQWSH